MRLLRLPDPFKVIAAERTRPQCTCTRASPPRSLPLYLRKDFRGVWSELSGLTQVNQTPIFLSVVGKLQSRTTKLQSQTRWLRKCEERSMTSKIQRFAPKCCKKSQMVNRLKFLGRSLRAVSLQNNCRRTVNQFSSIQREMKIVTETAYLASFAPFESWELRTLSSSQFSRRAP